MWRRRTQKVKGVLVSISLRVFRIPPPLRCESPGINNTCAGATKLSTAANNSFSRVVTLA